MHSREARIERIFGVRNHRHMPNFPAGRSALSIGMNVRAGNREQGAKRRHGSKHVDHRMRPTCCRFAEWQI